MARKKKAEPIKEGQVYITDLQIADRYDVSRPTIWRWLKNGDLPKPYKFNGATRWKLEDLEKMEDKLSEMAKEGKKFIPERNENKVRHVVVQNDDLPTHIMHYISLGSLQEIEKTMEECFFDGKEGEFGDEYLQEINWNFKKHCESGKTLKITFTLTEIEGEEDDDS